jgi:DNA mismatch repair ATPase MutL
MFIYVNGRVAKIASVERIATQIFRQSHAAVLPLAAAHTGSSFTISQLSQSAASPMTKDVRKPNATEKAQRVEFLSRRYPFMMLSIKMSRSLFDVNLTPDKAEFLFRDEGLDLRLSLFCFSTMIDSFLSLSFYRYPQEACC